jgi:uncharacterized SAM-binding protein YcdF (DUF218 family)
MPQDTLLRSVLIAVALPPGPSIVLLLLAVLFQSPRARAVFLVLGLASLYFSSLSVTAAWLRGRLDIYPPVALEHVAAEAIVVLGADRRGDAVEFGGDTMSGLGLERLRYAAWLHKKTGLPVLASGGSPGGGKAPEAELMRAVLKEFGVETRWTEGGSANTYENGLFSSRLLKGVGIGEILLVTHAWHMPRALEAFEKAGMRVVPAPVGAMGGGSGGDAGSFRDWLPKASALHMNYYALHEMLGRLWYRYRYYGPAE